MLDIVIEARRRSLGAFEVGRVLPFAKRRMVGPFVFFDHMGPMALPPHVPRDTDVRPHPHIGLSTVTYLFEGEITHRDSICVEQVIRPGEVNWMTSGGGISHSERFDTLREKGGAVHGIQAWVGLPENEEERAPAFAHYEASELPVFHEKGVEARLIAGNAYGMTNKVATHSPMFYLHVTMEPGGAIGMPRGHKERAAYVTRGRVEYDGHAYDEGAMLVFRENDDARISALVPSIVMLLGGEPIGPRHIWWNFVSSRKERIEQAKADWQAGRFRLPIHDQDEFIPLPEEPRPQTPHPEPEPMS